MANPNALDNLTSYEARPKQLHHEFGLRDGDVPSLFD